RPPTYADLLDLPDNVVGEIVAGELHVSPRPAPRHANATSVLGGRMNTRWQLGEGGPGGWWILDEPELHLGDDILVPDLGGWRRETLPSLPETAWFSVRPDWACEVISPSTARLDRGPKMDAYRAAGVPWLWIVDPVLRTLEVHEHSASGYVRVFFAADDAEVDPPPFGGVPFPLGSLWV
ncbi:MAG: Uma2 family endonuclease, partial [Myxococcales bacterium]|nr:Uma2 family endonuclease [Myxococcales bacterium]